MEFLKQNKQTNKHVLTGQKDNQKRIEGDGKQFLNKRQVLRAQKIKRSGNFTGKLLEPGHLEKDYPIEYRSDDVIKMKFVKLWDLLRYSERTTSKTPTRQKLAIRGKLSLRY